MIPPKRDRPEEADAAAEPSLMPTEPQEVRADEPPPESGRCVLVVDDSSMMRRLVGSVVTQLGHKVVEAKDGKRVLALAREVEPDLIVLDVNMPDKDGLEVLRELRAEPRFARTPVIMLTVEAGREVIAKALSGRVSDYLVKPLSVAELRKRIARYLDDLGSSLAEE